MFTMTEMTQQSKETQTIKFAQMFGIQWFIVVANEWKLPVGGYEIDYIRSIYENWIESQMAIDDIIDKMFAITWNK